MLNFKVDQEKCIHCCQCAGDCPAGIIKMEEGLPVVPSERGCMECGHCMAVCPSGAISILGKRSEDCQPLPEKNRMRSNWLEGLIKGRRSIRSFLPQDLSREEVSMLLETARHAPTGHNDQSVHVSVVNGQEAMKALKNEVYAGLERELSNAGRNNDIRSSLLGWALSMWKKKGVDALFRNAPGLVIAHAPRTAAAPTEDCIIALATFDLVAQAAGLGTLWDGLATWTIADFCPGLREKLGIPEDHVFGYAMVFGKPAVTYHRTVDRSPAPIHWAEITE